MLGRSTEVDVVGLQVFVPTCQVDLISMTASRPNWHGKDLNQDLADRNGLIERLSATRAGGQRLQSTQFYGFNGVRPAVYAAVYTKWCFASQSASLPTQLLSPDAARSGAGYRQGSLIVGISDRYDRIE